MKYTRIVFVTTLMLGIAQVPLSAQSNAYITPSPTLANGSAAFNSAPSALATDSDQAGQDSVLTIKTRVDEVNLLFIATDKHGKFVRDLSQNDFSILDDHKPPSAIINFRREVDLPLELGRATSLFSTIISRRNLFWNFTAKPICRWKWDCSSM